MADKTFANSGYGLRKPEERNKKIILYILAGVVGVMFIVVLFIIIFGLINAPIDEEIPVVPDEGEPLPSGGPCTSNEECIEAYSSIYVCGQNGKCVIGGGSGGTPSGNGDGGDGGDGDGDDGGITGFFAKFTGWVAGGTNTIYYNGGKVGIGTASPEVLLEVYEAPPYNKASIFKVTGVLPGNNSIGDSVGLVRSTGFMGNSSGGAGLGNGHQILDKLVRLAPGDSWKNADMRIQFMVDSTKNGFIASRNINNANGDDGYGESLVFGNGVSDQMVIRKDGKVGIGTASPEVLLEVSDTTPPYNKASIFKVTGVLPGNNSIGDYVGLVRSTGFMGDSSGGAGLGNGHQIMDKLVRLAPGNSWKNADMRIQFAVDNTNNGFIASRNINNTNGDDGYGESLVFGNGVSDQMVIRKDGKVIITNLASLTGTGNAYVCVDASGKLYRSSSACA